MNHNDLLSIENDFLRVGISKDGAEMRVLFDQRGGYDILKRQDDPSWGGTAPILFPICGRLSGLTTRVGGKEYHMEPHGFLKQSRLTLLSHAEDKIVFTLSDSEELYASAYPFRFVATVEYALEGSTLTTRVTVENRDTALLPFAVGFHPAFRLPLAEGLTRGDAYLEFPIPTEPRTWRLTEGGYLLRGTDPLPLSESVILPLSEAFFEKNDSVFLEKTGGCVRLRSTGSERSIRIDYAGIPYLGLWRPAGDGVNYVCIEPWVGTPDYDGEVTELSEKRDMILLPPGESRSVSYGITVEK